MLMFSTDENDIFQFQKMNHAKTRCLCKIPKKFRLSCTKTILASLIILVDREYDRRPDASKFLSSSPRVNAITVYTDVLKLWIIFVIRRRPHFSRSTLYHPMQPIQLINGRPKTILTIFFSITPSSSPGIVLTRCYICGIVKRDRYRHPHNTIALSGQLFVYSGIRSQCTPD